LPWCDGRAESAWESLLRVLHVSADVPVVPQHEVRQHGRFVARGDLWLEGTTTLHEYDGVHHRSPTQQRKDLARDRRLANAGWTRRGYTAVEVLHEATAIIRDADLALGRQHDPSRVHRWRQMVVESLFTTRGRDRLSVRLTNGSRTTQDRGNPGRS
jgi:very-short-patch-repair endonuclease